jgi:periplasmic divalent cation tolerance protein
MSTKTNFIIVFMTTADKEEAEKISQALLKEKLIACANIVNPVTSLFNWSGKVDVCDECLVVMKSRLDLFDELEKCVRELHSYETPEVLAFPIVEGSKTYLDWMDKELK